MELSLQVLPLYIGTVYHLRATRDNLSRANLILVCKCPSLLHFDNRSTSLLLYNMQLSQSTVFKNRLYSGGIPPQLLKKQEVLKLGLPFFTFKTLLLYFLFFSMNLFIIK